MRRGRASAGGAGQPGTHRRRDPAPQAAARRGLAGRGITSMLEGASLMPAPIWLGLAPMRLPHPHAPFQVTHPRPGLPSEPLQPPRTVPSVAPPAQPPLPILRRASPRGGAERRAALLVDGIPKILRSVNLHKGRRGASRQAVAMTVPASLARQGEARRPRDRRRRRAGAGRSRHAPESPARGRHSRGARRAGGGPPTSPDTGPAGAIAPPKGRRSPGASRLRKAPGAAPWRRRGGRKGRRSQPPGKSGAAGPRGRKKRGVAGQPRTLS